MLIDPLLDRGRRPRRARATRRQARRRARDGLLAHAERRRRRYAAIGRASSQRPAGRRRCGGARRPSSRSGRAIRSRAGSRRSARRARTRSCTGSPTHRALVPGDVILGARTAAAFGSARRAGCPSATSVADLARSLRPLLELPVRACSSRTGAGAAERPRGARAARSTRSAAAGHSAPSAAYTSS